MAEMKESPVSKIIGFWTGAAIWLVIMTAFGWWVVWWAYFPLIGVFSGAIRQTANYLHNQKQTTQLQNQTVVSGATIASDQEHSISTLKTCSGCGEMIEDPNIKFCSYCGAQLN
ncbi:hypothetical protein [Candidatus Lokiarchaeum ossiferum]|uniref:hypothetical protein n=1 Tax=Candidatus Lokiarchaeum ossiferum TaxID=2951803 RepID=UPI00352FC661